MCATVLKTARNGTCQSSCGSRVGIDMPLTAAIAGDLAFDARLPAELRRKSSVHFTPVDIARRAAVLAAPSGSEIVLDVGAGVGKFCLIAAHQRRAAHFVGVEVRPQLVTVATRLATEWRLPNVSFVCGDAFDLDWSDFRAFYFFNPFAEQLLPSPFKLDDALQGGPDGFERCVARTLERLDTARPDTRVVLLQGFGAAMPGSYELVSSDRLSLHALELWIRTS